MSDHIPALDALYPLPPQELSRQWVLTRSESGPADWRHNNLHGWHLFSHPDASVCRLESAHGQQIGWVIEALAYLQAEGDVIPQDAITLPLPTDPTPAEIEAALYGRDASGRANGDGFAGNWTAILLTPDGSIQRLYLGATHSVVYAPERRVAATTHNLITGLKRDNLLTKSFDPVSTSAFYTFGLTPFRGLHRLLPNHFLDLRTFEPARHWPRSGFQSRVPGEHGAAEIARHARRLLAVLALRYQTFKVPLSAGNDSRAVLACLRPIAEQEPNRVSLFTSRWPALEADVDVQIARKVARLAGLPLTVKEVRPQPADQAAMLREYVRLGESKWGPILRGPSQETERPPPDVISLPGMAGETARAFYWNGSIPDAASITPRELAARTGSPAIPPLLQAAERWLASLPEGVRQCPPDVLDLVYVELRMGCWDASSRYLWPGPGRANISLMGSTAAIDTMLRLPVDYRMSGRLQRDIVAHAWPELLAFPFNEPVGALRLRAFLSRLEGALRRRAGRLRRRLVGPSATETKKASADSG